jgi:hypothetical protein
MAKSRSSNRSRTGRHESGRAARDQGEYGSGYHREEDYDRGGNGGSPPDYYDEERGQRRSFVRSVGRKFSEMDLEKAMVLLHTALAIAIVIKQSRDRSRGRRGEPFRSAVSVLNHYLNEGRELSEAQRATLEDIKEELRMLYEREEDEAYSPSGG